MIHNNLVSSILLVSCITVKIEYRIEEILGYFIDLWLGYYLITPPRLYGNVRDPKFTYLTVSLKKLCPFMYTNLAMRAA